MHLSLQPTTHRDRPLKIQHTTYDLVHPPPRNPRAQELNIRHTTHDSLSPLQPLLPQTSHRRTYQTHSSIPIPKPSRRLEREEPIRNGSLRKRVREYVRPKSKEKDRSRSIPKIVLLQHTPTTTSLPLHSPPKIPPSDAEILAFLGIDTSTRARKTARMEMEEEYELRQATRATSRSASSSPEQRGVSEVYSRYDEGDTDEEQRGRSPAPKSRKAPQEGKKGERPTMPPRKESKLLPPPPLRSFNSAPEQSHTRLPAPLPSKPATPQPRTTTHKRTPSSQSRTLSGYLTTGTAQLHAKRLSTLHQLSTSVTRAAQLYRSRERERERRRSDASSESVESFFCAGDSSAGERSVSPLGRKSDSGREEENGRCRLCGEGMDAWREKGSGLCRGCEGEFKRPVTRYGGDGGEYAILSDKKWSRGREAVREEIAPLPPIAPAYRETSLSSGHEIQPTKTRRGNRTPSPHPLSKSPPRTTIPNMPILNSSRYKDKGTVIVPAASTQHIAFQLRSPTLVNHSPRSSITPKPNTGKKDVDGVWGKYHVSGMKQKERERYDASRVCRDSLFYELYDEVLNDYCGRSGENF